MAHRFLNRRIYNNLDDQEQPDLIEEPADTEPADIVPTDIEPAEIEPKGDQLVLDEETSQDPASPGDNTSEKAALVINVYSWMTPVFGILMLAAGLLLGYFGRPLLTGQKEGTANIPQATSAADVSSSATPDQVAGDQTSPEEMMAFLTSQVRHFKGAETAPITIIEFSDYQ